LIFSSLFLAWERKIEKSLKARTLAKRLFQRTSNSRERKKKVVAWSPYKKVDQKDNKAGTYHVHIYSQRKIFHHH
jgi:hypothetical protein